MPDFFQALFNYDFLQNAVLASILASIGCGLTGPFVLINRISYLAGGIAHAVLGGVGAAVYFGFEPLLGALVTAIFSALLISYIKLVFNQHEDIVIGALWSVGMATGILFISQTPGYNTELVSYLFGNVLMVADNQLKLLLVLDLVLVFIIFLFYKYFVAISFDPEFARTRGVRLAFFYTLLLCMIAITIVLLIQIVGLILVIALLTLPATIASHFTQSLFRIIFISVLAGMVFTSSGLFLSYHWDFPAGATIILVTAGTYLLSLLGLRLYRSFANSRIKQ